MPDVQSGVEGAYSGRGRGQDLRQVFDGPPGAGPPLQPDFAPLPGAEESEHRAGVPGAMGET